MLALSQSVLHLYYDYDRVVLPATNPIPESATERNIQLVTPPLIQLKSNALPLAKKILLHSSTLVALCPFVYALFIRRTAWSTAFFFGRIVWSIPKASELSYIPPFHWTLILRSFISGLVLLSLWEVSNAVFDAYVAQEPLKRGKPFTNDSRDINASLVNGLKSTKEPIYVGYTTEIYLIIADYIQEFRVLGTILHLPMLRGPQTDHIFRHRSSRRIYVVTNPNNLLGTRPRHQHAYRRISEIFSSHSNS